MARCFLRPVINQINLYNEREREQILLDGLCGRYKLYSSFISLFIVQELCESRGGRPELSVLTSLLASVDVKIY